MENISSDKIENSNFCFADQRLLILIAILILIQGCRSVNPIELNSPGGRGKVELGSRGNAFFEFYFSAQLYQQKKPRHRNSTI